MRLTAQITATATLVPGLCPMLRPAYVCLYSILAVLLRLGSE